MQTLRLLLSAPNSCKDRGTSVFVHNFLPFKISFLIAHLVEQEDDVWKVSGSNPGENIFSSPKGMQLMGANIAANSFIINSLFICKIYNQKLQILHQ